MHALFIYGLVLQAKQVCAKFHQATLRFFQTKFSRKSSKNREAN